jgi:hypothetical protein
MLSSFFTHVLTSTSPAKSNSDHYGQRDHITRQNLERIPGAPSKLHTYLQRDQNFERVPLYLQTGRPGGREMVSRFEEEWKMAGRAR